MHENLFVNKSAGEVIYQYSFHTIFKQIWAWSHSDTAVAVSDVATGSAPPPPQRKHCQTSGKRGRKLGKSGKGGKKSGKRGTIRKVLSLCPSWQMGLATLYWPQFYWLGLLHTENHLYCTSAAQFEHNAYKHPCREVYITGMLLSWAFAYPVFTLPTQKIKSAHCPKLPIQNYLTHRQNGHHI